MSNFPCAGETGVSSAYTSTHARIRALMTTSDNQRLEELYQFGPFRIDPARETLLKEGVAVPLTPKTFQILLVLVRHGKEIVTKDDLMKTVWPDTFVEEANLSRNIFMLRKALGETAQDHRYIVTVPGRGYRLAENVHLVPGQEFAIAAASQTRVQIEVKETRPWKWIALTAVVLLIVAVALLRLVSRRAVLGAAVLGAKDTVVLGDFANSTGDPMFGETLRQGLAIQLRQSPYLSLISDQRITHALRLMGHRADARLTPELARGVCERTGSTAILEGSIAPLGSEYVLTLQARSCRTGEVLDQEQVQAAKKEDVLSSLGQVASHFRNRVGESLATIQEHNTPLAEATTPSLEALEAYSAGWKLHTSNGAMAGFPLLKRAVEIDPNFALAQATLAREYADLDESDLSAESATRAWLARDHAGDREKFYITATYEGLATGNLEAARQNDEAWAHTYPRDPVPHSMLSGYPNKAAGRYQQAIVEARRSIELDPDFAIGYYNLGVNNVYLNHLDEAENVLHRAAGRGVEIDEFIMLEHDIAFLKGDQATMERAAARARERSGGDTWISNKEAYALAYSGQLQKARVSSRRAVDQALQEAQPERAGLFEAGASLREAFFDDTPQARLRAMSALGHSNNHEIEFGAALALAITGDAGRAQGFADELERRSPEDTVVRFIYLPVLRARIALDQDNAAKAIELLQSTGPYELGASRGLFGALYPAYMRGEAYLAAGRGAEAAIEFQKILDHRGVVGSDPIGALAHLQLGRAFVLAGDKAKAKAAYDSFFTLWKDADPGVPILNRAHAEYLALDSR
jgi:DNA-binding winged helix-turn-helix (wHTH) protein/tetratricopeptide (TPR) repeat protein